MTCYIYSFLYWCISDYDPAWWFLSRFQCVIYHYSLPAQHSMHTCNHFLLIDVLYLLALLLIFSFLSSIVPVLQFFLVTFQTSLNRLSRYRLIVEPIPKGRMTVWCSPRSVLRSHWTRPWCRTIHPLRSFHACILGRCIRHLIKMHWFLWVLRIYWMHQD